MANATSITDADWNSKTTAEKFAYALDNYKDLNDNQRKWVQEKAQTILRPSISNSDRNLNKTNIFVKEYPGNTTSFKIGPLQPNVVLGPASAGSDSAFAIGEYAQAVGNYSIALGYEPYAFSKASIALGYEAYALPIINPSTQNVAGSPDSISDNGLALGNLSVVTGRSIGIGGGATSLGYGGLAIGALSVITAPGMEKYSPGYAQITQNGDVWLDYLESKGLPRNHNGTGLTPDQQSTWNEIDNDIREKYKDYLSYINYDALADSSDIRVDAIMSALRYQYVMEIKNKQPSYGTALGTEAITNVTTGVALGAYSVADRGGFDQDKPAPYSNVNLKDQTMGAVSIGGQSFVYERDEYGSITNVTRGPQKLRQLINLADGTEATDAVNLRQLKAAIDGVRNTGGGGDGSAVVVTQGDSNVIVKGDDSTANNGQTVHTYFIKLAPKLTADSFSVNNGPSMTTEGINANNQRISNVAPGRAGTTDAVNMQQLSALQSNVNTLQSNVNRIEHSVRKIRKEMRSIGANSTAIASLPQVMHAGKSQIAMATGVYRDASSVAIGWSHANEKGNTVFKLNGAISSNGDATAGVGFGYEY
ncbi:hypothetical protein HKX40_08285 [Pelistega europaea]|uniref:DOMON domain-containing protein n=2 Tax=Pelistega europaea TaxID=106147 RepID=A0A7Y4P536_9BURK|nr:hypothetical protein [Pelistega europaea]